MEFFSESETETEQQDPSAAIAPAPAQRGRPWAKGKSGNPKGRPSRAHQAAYVAHALIDRKTVQLTNKLIEKALAGDRMALRLCVERLAPPRREAPAWLKLPPIENRDDLRQALAAVATAAAQGDISPAQSQKLAKMLHTMFYLI